MKEVLQVLFTQESSRFSETIGAEPILNWNPNLLPIGLVLAEPPSSFVERVIPPQSGSSLQAVSASIKVS